MSVREDGVGVSTRITTATTTVVKAKDGTLYRIIVGTTAAGAITLYDNASAASGTVLGVLKASIGEGSYAFGLYFKNGLVVVTAAASDITVVYE